MITPSLHNLLSFRLAHDVVRDRIARAIEETMTVEELPRIHELHAKELTRFRHRTRAERIAQIRAFLEGRL